MDRPRILLVDGNEEFRQGIAGRLASEGFDVKSERSGCAGVEAITKHTFDLVLVDMGLPEAQGLTVYQHLRGNAKTRDVPIFLLNDLAPTGYWEQIPYDTDGLCFVVRKREDPTILFARINEVIG